MTGQQPLRVCRYCGAPIEALEHTLNGADNLEWAHHVGQYYYVKCRQQTSKATP